MQGAKAFCNVLTLRESVKLNGIKDVTKWLKAFHWVFYEHVERYLRLRPGQPLSVRILSVSQEPIETFDFGPYLPWNYAASLPASER